MSIQYSEFLKALANHPNGLMQFVLPNRETVPEAYHITDVGVVTRQLIDCGGVTRNEQKLHLQLWLGSDTDHRLTTDKTLKIFSLSKNVLAALRSEETELKVEYQIEVNGMSLFSLFDLSEMRLEDNQLVCQLESPQTTCLAKERVEQQQDGCCGSSQCC